jgi:D-threonine aldolase
MKAAWHKLSNEADVPSPALLVYVDRVRENIRRMVAMVDDVSRLRPHIKTHKMAEVLRMHLDAGITRFKCATIAEAEMAAATGAPDVLLAYQPVGPNVTRLQQLARLFPQTKFSCIADDEGAIRTLANAWAGAASPLEVLLDLDCGMRRSGIAPGPEAAALYQLIAGSSGLKPGGLHAYDGHNREVDPAARKAACDAYMAPIRALRDELQRAGLMVPRLVASGSPTYPIHACSKDIECSPGTTVFWDAGYGDRFKDTDFLPAALVFTRVVSKPGPGRLCLDLGHKAIASEMPHPRVHFIGLADATAVTHSEEHLVVETARAAEFTVGDALYGVPQHVCPTVALHGLAVVVENGRATGRWKIVARERVITV